MAKLVKMAGAAKKGARIVTMAAAATAMCETVGMDLDKGAMMAAMRDMGVPVEERAAVIVSMDPFGDDWCA